MLVKWVTALTFGDMARDALITQEDTVGTYRVEGLSADGAGDGDGVADPAGYGVPLDDWEDGFFDLHLICL